MNNAVMRMGQGPTIPALVVVGYALVLLAVMGLGWIALTSMERLHGINRDLYEQPQAVSNAASDLNGTLLQLRAQMLQIAVARDQGDDGDELLREVVSLARRARADLAVIKTGFVGEPGKVAQLEHKLDEWDIIRAEIAAAAARRDHAAAENFVRILGAPKFAEITPLADRVLNDVLNRGRRFADEAEDHSARIIGNLRGLISLLLLFILATGMAVVARVRSLQAELARLATTDSLTGVPNRRHFMDFANRELTRSQRYGAPFALAIADLDSFKAINDTHGHQVGDQVLRSFADLARQMLRDADVVGRIGGEEFAILLPNTSPHEAREVMERMRSAIEASDVNAGLTTPLRFTASFGIAAYSVADQDVATLLKRADEALYQAKHGGRNRVCVSA